jgi:hypothetical protein
MSKISGITAKWLALLQEKLPDRQVGLTPADALFTRKVELPPNLEWEDKLAYIELALEGNAPFPMEQLAWGFLESEDSPFVFVYATPKSRLRRLEIEDAEKYHQLFPGFISLFGETFDKPSVRFLSQNGVISALVFPANNPVPEKVLSRKVAADLLTDDVLLEARNRLAGSIKGNDVALEDGLWLGEGVRIQNDGIPVFKHRHLSEGTPQGIKEHPLVLGENTLWAADLRDHDFANRERVTRKRSKLIWNALRAAVVTAIVLLLLQIANVGLSAYNVYREGKLDELEPRATRVENKLTLATRLTQSTEEDLKPFLLMEAINPLRPDSIYFDKVRSRAFNQLEIEGESTEGVTPVNAFADSINQLPNIESVVNNSRTRNNQTSFEFLITFASLPEAPEGGFVIPDEEEDEDAEEETEGNDNG